MDSHSRMKKDMKILVVDDTHLNLKLLSDLLTTAGYTVATALNGQKALEAAAEDAPDLILLDITMPVMDGYETCLALKSDPFLKDIPVIFISSMNETSDKLMGFEVGGVDYIAKPFKEAEVLARVKTHITMGQLKKDAVDQMAAYLREIEKRNRIEQELKRSRAELEQIVMSIPLILIAVSATDKVIHWNPSAHFALGLQADQAIGMDIASCPVRWDWSTLNKAMEECRNQGLMVHSEDIKYFRPTGNSGVLAFAISPLIQEEEEHNGLLLLGTDISDWR